MPAADASRRGRACQLPVHGPVRRAARARSTSHHFLTLLHFDASRICMRAERQASSCASAPQPAKLNPTPAVILSLGPRLARRFARSLHLHPYNCALLHRCMPPCLARVLLLSPPRFPFDLQTPDRLALLKHTHSRARPVCTSPASIHFVYGRPIDTMVFCTYCGQSFTRDEHLERHILTRSSPPCWSRRSIPQC